MAVISLALLFFKVNLNSTACNREKYFCTFKEETWQIRPKIHLTQGQRITRQEPVRLVERLRAGGRSKVGKVDNPPLRHVRRVNNRRAGVGKAVNLLSGTPWTVARNGAARWWTRRARTWAKLTTARAKCMIGPAAA